MRACVLVLAVLLGGCNQLLGVDEFSTAGDDDDDELDAGGGAIDAMVAVDADPEQAASIDATWAIVDGYIADGNSAGACPPGVGEAKLHVEGPTPTVASFACATGVGTVPNRALGSYDVWLELTNGSGAMIAQSPRFAVELDTADTTESVVVTIDAYNGFVEASWDITKMPCDGDEDVSLLFTLPPTDAYEELFDCTAGEVPAMVRTAAIPIGTMPMAAALLNDVGQGIGQSPEQNVEIEYGNQIVSLGTLHIERIVGLR